MLTTVIKTNPSLSVCRLLGHGNRQSDIRNANFRGENISSLKNKKIICKEEQSLTKTLMCFK